MQNNGKNFADPRLTNQTNQVSVGFVETTNDETNNRKEIEMTTTTENTKTDRQAGIGVRRHTDLSEYLIGQENEIRSAFAKLNTEQLKDAEHAKSCDDCKDNYAVDPDGSDDFKSGVKAAAKRISITAGGAFSKTVAGLFTKALKTVDECASAITLGSAGKFPGYFPEHSAMLRERICLHASQTRAGVITAASLAYEILHEGTLFAQIADYKEHAFTKAIDIDQLIARVLSPLDELFFVFGRKPGETGYVEDKDVQKFMQDFTTRVMKTSINAVEKSPRLAKDPEAQALIRRGKEILAGRTNSPSVDPEAFAKKHEALILSTAARMQTGKQGEPTPEETIERLNELVRSLAEKMEGAPEALLDKIAQKIMSDLSTHANDDEFRVMGLGVDLETGEIEELGLEDTPEDVKDAFKAERAERALKKMDASPAKHNPDSPWAQATHAAPKLAQ